MSEIVIKVPKLRPQLEKEVARGIEALAKAEVSRAFLLEQLDMMFSKSKLTEKDAIELGRKLKKGRYEKLRKKGLV